MSRPPQFVPARRFPGLRQGDPPFVPNPLRPLDLGGPQDGVAVCTFAPAETLRRGEALCAVRAGADVEAPERELADRDALREDVAMPATPYLRLERGFVEPRMCVALSRRGDYVPSTRGEPQDERKQGYAIGDDETVVLPPPSAPRQRLKGTAVLIGVPSRNYFHWMIEAIGRLVVAQQEQPAARPLLTRKLSTLQRRVLEFAGVDARDLLPLPKQGLAEVDDLHVPPSGALPGGQVVPSVVRALSKTLAAGGASGAFPRRVYVSRGDAPRRRVANEEEVVAALEQLGFVSLELNGMPMAEQVQLFGSAEAVITIHGAALTNILFCAPETVVIELQPERLDTRRTTLFWTMATIAGLRYAQLVCHALRADAPIAAAGEDVVVDVGVLREMVDDLLG